MKISREASVFLTLALIVSILVGKVWVWFELIAWIFGIVIFATVLARMLKAVCKPESKTSKELDKVSKALKGYKEITLRNIAEYSSEVRKIDEDYMKSYGSRCNLHIIAFAKDINLIQSMSDRLPNGLTYVIACKAMYEINRIYGSLEFRDKAPTIGRPQILRALANSEVQNFILFCQHLLTYTQPKVV